MKFNKLKIGINFSHLKAYMKMCDSHSEAFVLSLLKLLTEKAYIKKYGALQAVTSMKEICQRTTFSNSKIQKLIASLQSKGLIKKRVSTWYGNPALFLHTTDLVEKSPFNHKFFENIRSHCGSFNETMIFCRILYSFSNTHLYVGQKMYCAFTSDQLMKYSGLSKRSIGGLTASLAKAGLMEKETLIFKKKTLAHYHIPTEVIHRIGLAVDNFDDTPGGPKANKTHTVKPEKRTKEIYNNKAEPTPSGPLLFSSSYVKEGLLEEIRKKFKFNNQLLVQYYEEMKFSIRKMLEGGGFKSFLHAKSTCFKLIRQGRWKTPWGFKKYSDYGKSSKARIEKAQKDHIATKKISMEQSRGFFMKIKSAYEEAMSDVESKKDELTMKGIELAKKVKAIQRLSKGKGGIESVVNEMVNKMHRLFLKGADRQAVLSELKS